MFLRKKKGGNSTRGDSDEEWKELADEVNKYDAMASNDCDDSCGSGEEDINDDDLEGCEDNERIDTDIDKEREQSDELMIDECEESAEKGELDASDLVLEPLRR